MNVLAENEGKVYGAIAIGTPGDFVSPYPDTLFLCMIWDHDGGFSEAQRAVVARRLLQAGCRYAICGGKNCEAWHDAVDIEFIEQHADDPDEVRETVHVMTTCHADESPDDVAFFFVLSTDFALHDLSHYLVLHVGTSPAKEQVDAAVRKYALNEKAV